MTIDPNEKYVYVGAERKCGCLVTVVSDEECRKAEIGKTLCRWLADGLVIQRLTLKQFHEDATFLNCTHDGEPIQKTL